MKKILNINELRSIRKKYKKNKIILAHGTFDFFHYGHLKHLLESKKQADILVVSLTADKFIKKGLGRPVYNQEQRAEIISSLNFVDYVAIINSISGVEVIESLKPNLYSKGVEYKKRSNDFTNKILLEEKTLKKCGGKIFYSNQLVLSSSSLINQIDKNSKSPKNLFLKKFRNKINFNFIYKNFENISKKKILIVGDSILDEYIFTKSLAKSPKEELISVKEDKRKIYMGGILATAKHISNFVKKPTLLTIIGNDTKTNSLIKKSFSNKKCNLVFIKDKKRKNIKKTRYLDEHQNKLFQSNEIPYEDISNDLENKVLSYLNKSLKNFDLVVVNDFGHGFLTSKIRRVLEKKSKRLAINVQSNSANLGYNFYNKYKKCDYLTIDEPEARMATGERFGKIEILIKKILKEIKAKNVAITYGPNGTKIFSKGKIYNVPALSSNPVDTLGAGDAFFAISSIYTLIDKEPENIAFIGNLSGSLKIQYLGHEKYLEPDTLFPYLKSLLS